MSTKITEEFLEEMIPKATKINLEQEMPKLLNQPPVHFSFNFERKMDRLMKKSNKINTNISSTIKKVACFVIIMAIGITTIVMQVDAYRTKLFKILNQVFDIYGITWFQVVIDEAEEEEIMEPSYVPTEYKKGTEIQEKDFAVFEYGSDKERIRIEANRIKEDLKLYLDTEYDTKEVITIRNGTAELYTRKKEYRYLVFYKGNIRYAITVKESFDLEELIKIANSI